jgi:hypothetical protein
MRLILSIALGVGLHHHGQSPDKAGYTIRELARLSRSTVPSQRTIALQSLGAVLAGLYQPRLWVDYDEDGAEDLRQAILAHSMCHTRSLARSLITHTVRSICILINVRCA